MKFVFLMDPLATVVMKKDTSFILMLGAHQRGHEVYYLPDGGMTLIGGRLHFHVTRVVPRRVEKEPFQLKENTVLKDTDIHAVFIRSDPPFDEQYLINTWLLDNLPSSVAVINSPSGIRTVNEKIWVTRFTSIVPPTLVGRHRAGLRAFLSRQKEVIAKPTQGFGGQSVFRLQHSGPNTNVILETLTEQYRRDIILQKFLPESARGDKRIILLNGEPLGAVLRVHNADDHRNNFFTGGQPKPTKITANDLSIIAVLRPELQRLGLHFVGIDVMGNYLIEVNVTSPTGLQEIDALENKQLELDVIRYAEGLVKKVRTK